MRFEVAAEPWVKREATWNHYSLRSSMTYDNFFGEHILNQNGFYEYVMGFQGAARDPLQHCLPFIFKMCIRDRQYAPNRTSPKQFL